MNESKAKSLMKARERAYQYGRIKFWLNGAPLECEIAPAQTTLEFLNKELNLWGTKCSCNEGDCGACTVVIARQHEGIIIYEAVTSCLYNAARLHGKHLITIEGLGTPEKLHPIQQTMLDLHATQCGYCTPGFVMSLFALLAMVSHPTKEDILAALEGNLCRCTGYETILQASLHLAENYSPQDIVPDWCRKIEPEVFGFDEPVQYVEKTGMPLRLCQKFHSPASIEELLDIMGREKEYTLLNGGTDIMVQMNVQRREIPVLIDLSSIPGLDQVNFTHEGIRVGANVTYTSILHSGIISTDLPVLHNLVKRIASQQIRNFATLAGNIANASPIGDTLPLLLVLDAILILNSAAGERRVKLENFFLDYRKTALQNGEFIQAVLIPHPARNAYIAFKKAAKRKEVDISSAVSAVLIESREGRIQKARLGLGGAAPIPKLSRKFHNAMHNMELQGLHPEEIAAFVASEFQPISDVRGSDAYRTLLVRNHVLGFLKEFLAGRP
ncbi:MAG: xanthine dehydrogenase small subunit [Candidatus Syntrophosphaera sp.]